MDKIEPEGAYGELPEDREELRKWLEEKIRLLQTRLDELRVQAHLGQAEAKDEYEERAEEFKQKRRELESALEDLTGSGGQAFDHLFQGLKGAYRELKDSADQAYKAFKK